MDCMEELEMREWRKLLTALQDRLALIPGLEASPVPFSGVSLPATLAMVDDNHQAFCVEIPSTTDIGQRQKHRGKTGDGHTVTVSILSQISTTGSWADSMGRILDTEQLIRDVLVNARNFIGFRIRWGQTDRALTQDGAYVLSRIAITVDHESEVTDG